MSDEMQSPPPAPPVAGGDAPSDTGKILAAVGYLVGIVALIAILIEPYKNERFVRHHAIQALGVWVCWILLGIVATIPIIGWIIGAVGWIVLLVISILAAIKAFQGEYYEVPLIYGVVKNHI